MKRKYLLFLVLLFFLILIAALLLFPRSRGSPASLSRLFGDPWSTTYEGPKASQNTSQAAQGIAIPGITELTLKAKQTRQDVTIYNPEDNSCLMQFNLYANNVLIWESGNVEPGKGYYNIDLLEPLEAGTYNGDLVMNCYTPSGEQLNGADIKFPIYVN